MAKYSGKVFKIYDREWQGKKLYSIKLDGDPLYHRLNGKPPAGVDSGAYVSFDAEPNSDGKSTKVKGDVLVQTAPAPAAQAASPAGSYAARDVSIHYQSARKDALAFLDILTREKAVKLPTKQAAILATLEAALDMYTAKFYEDISTQGAVARANGTDAPAEEPAEEPSEED